MNIDTISANTAEETVTYNSRPVHTGYVDDTYSPSPSSKAANINLPAPVEEANPLADPVNQFFKRAFDIAFSLPVVLFIVGPIALVIAFLQWMKDPGPLFFTQERTGLDGKTFKIVKFRSMIVNPDANEVQATKGDPRITPLGEVMRNNSIDELPQFINVLIGDMSVVGPRPHMLSHTDFYAKEIDGYMERHAVKPGVTGWAQVCGWRGPTDELYKMVGRVEHDMEYIRNWSLLLDARCVWRTVTNIQEGEVNAV